MAKRGDAQMSGSLGGRNGWWWEESMRLCSPGDRPQFEWVRMSAVGCLDQGAATVRVRVPPTQESGGRWTEGSKILV